MSSLKMFVRKLREAANALESLFAEDTAAKAAIIRKSIIKPKKNIKKYIHWTQRPENKERVKAMARKAAATRNKEK